MTSSCGILGTSARAAGRCLISSRLCDDRWCRVRSRFVGLKFPDMSRPETLQKKYVGKLTKRALSFMKTLLLMDPAVRRVGEIESGVAKNPVVLTPSARVRRTA